VVQLNNGSAGPILLVVAVVLVIAYFVTRSAVLEIRSCGGGAITIGARSMRREELVSFVDAVEEAKLGAASGLAPIARSA